jgi:hypothetical protein
MICIWIKKDNLSNKSSHISDKSEISIKTIDTAYQYPAKNL